MGALCSSPVEPLEPRPHVNTELVFSAKAWEKDFPAITSVELKRRREEFWDTRVEGRKEIWQAIRLACEAGDEGTSLAILDSAGVTPFDMNKPDCCFSYDDMGVKYEVPMYLLRDPSNLLTDPHTSVPTGEVHTEVHHSQPLPTTSLPTTQPDEKNVDNNPQQQPLTTQPIATVTQLSSVEPGFKIKIRFSEGKDIELTVHATETVMELKNRLFTSNGIPIKDQRVIFSGKRLEDTDTMTSAKIKVGTLVQVMVVHMPK